MASETATGLPRLTALLISAVSWAILATPVGAVEAPTSSPSPRSDMGMAYDAARGEVVLFGGLDGARLLGDTWTWDGTDWTEEHPHTSPAPRCCMGMAYDAARKVVVLFSGDDELNDTWAWDGTDWTQKHPDTSPSPRSSFGMAYHARTQKIVIFGGYGGAQDPTWTWDGTTWTAQTPLHRPQWVFGPGMSEYRADVVMFGGEYICVEEQCYTRKTWLWNGADWSRPRHRPTSLPTRRAYMGMANDLARDRVVLFGGERFYGQLGGTWTWDGSTWTKEGSPPQPSRRWSMGTAYDEATQLLVLFGGEYYSNGDYRFLADTWVWDGRAWQRVS